MNYKNRLAKINSKYLSYYKLQKFIFEKWPIFEIFVNKAIYKLPVIQYTVKSIFLLA